MRKLGDMDRSSSRLSTRAGAGRGYDAVGKSIPVPTGGWNTLLPLASMPPEFAVRLINWFPTPGYVELRRGHISHCNTASGLPVETVATYHGDTTNAMFAWSGSIIYDVTTSTPSTSVTGLGSARAQFINFATTGGNFLWTCNGVDDPRYFDGTTWNTAAITGISGPDIIGVNSHKNRLWFTLVGSSDAAYLPVDQIQGAAVRFPLGGLWSLGGYLMAMGTWSLDAGNGPDDYAVFVSSRGQVAIYSGTNPASSTTWSLVGVFTMGAPIGRRCLTQVGADIAIICVDGVLPLSKAMIFERSAALKVSLTENIQPDMNQAARDYKDHFGWMLISYPLGTRAVLNIPQIENDTQVQFVMNTINGAWCRFEGMDANCWELLNDRLYFGGNDGVVYLADEGGGDPDVTMRADMMTSYNYYGDRGHLKRWMMCRPLLTTDQSVQPGLAFNVDFQTDAAISVTPTTPLGSALWDVAEWDVDVWAPGVVTQLVWASVTGLGYCASIRMVVDVLPTSVDEVTLQVMGFDLTMERGAFV